MDTYCGGSKDMSTFHANINHDVLPLPSSISCNGVFSQYLFRNDDDKNIDSEVVAVHVSHASAPNVFTGHKEYFLTLSIGSKYDGAGLYKHSCRGPLNLVVALDISGSMLEVTGPSSVSPSTGRSRESTTTKWDIAKQSLFEVIGQLQETDRFGLVVFNTKTEVLQPLTQWSASMLAQIKFRLASVSPGGGTDLSQALKVAGQMATQYLHEAVEDDYEMLTSEGTTVSYGHRVLLLTDAIPTAGDCTSEVLLESIQELSHKEIYSTVVGVGMDFNVDLVQSLVQVKGAQYLSMKTPSDFRSRIAGSFGHIMTPIAFDLRIRLRGANIVRIHGKPAPLDPTGDLVHIPTVYPKPQNEAAEVFLIELQNSIETEPNIVVDISFVDRDGSAFTQTRTVDFSQTFVIEEEEHGFFADDYIRKAILLSRYVSCVQNALTGVKRFDPEKVTTLQKLYQFMREEIRMLQDDRLVKELEAVCKLMKKFAGHSNVQTVAGVLVASASAVRACLPV
eukprot:GILK01004708.1.p1 GENE.GILK01004708.1~~GILK01004708.1.p1  ORF type:complete len:506 (+),score=108.73 GILK01004708.1:157-1674(+)